MLNKILITSSADSFNDTSLSVDQLSRFVFLPVMHITHLCIDNELDTINSNQPCWMLFTSKSALKPVFGNRKFDFPIAVIGKGTLSELKKYSYDASFIPSEARAEVFAEEFSEHLKSIKFDGDINIFKGNTASNYISDYLIKNGFSINNILAYTVKKKDFNASNKDSLKNYLDTVKIRKIKKAKVPGLIVTLSSLQADFIYDEILNCINESDIKEEVDVFNDIHLITIGSNTRRHLLESGFKNVYLSQTQTRESLLVDSLKIFDLI